MRRKYCPAIGYTPPETTKSHVREFLVGEETLDRYLGSSIHIFLPHVPLLDFACLIPKGDFATMCLLGEDIDEELVQSFMKTPEFRECLPPEVIVQECSRCYPRLNICGAGEPFADRTVAIGDSGITRLYKDGIGTAYRTAKAAAALIKPGKPITEGLLNRIKVAWWPYHPCFACATHSLPGRSPIPVCVYDGKGNLVNRPWSGRRFRSRECCLCQGSPRGSLVLFCASP